MDKYILNGYDKDRGINIVANMEDYYGFGLLFIIVV
jgi:hypothetical protein